MNSTNLIMICISAFLSVFFLLAVLAIVMRIIIVVFPQKETSADQAMVAVISTMMQTVYPGTKITNIEEIK